MIDVAAAVNGAIAIAVGVNGRVTEVVVAGNVLLRLLLRLLYWND
jgi:hypothetical protein